MIHKIDIIITRLFTIQTSIGIIEINQYVYPYDDENEDIKKGVPVFEVIFPVDAEYGKQKIYASSLYDSIDAIETLILEWFSLLQISINKDIKCFTKTAKLLKKG